MDKTTKSIYKPFLDYAKLQACGCSVLLQRRLVDFSSERSMEDSSKALIEHYGVLICASVINKITQEIGAEAKYFNSLETPDIPEKALLVAQIDGSMVPIVEYTKASKEQRAKGIKRNRSCFWKEFRLSTVSEVEDNNIRYGVTSGSALEAGCMMYLTCKNKGMSETTHIHGVGDGAPWIAEQYEIQFGANHHFIIDFYHASEYLAAASKEVSPTKEEQEKWYEQKKADLLTDKSSAVISNLRSLQKVENGTEEGSLTKALRYFENREYHLNYGTVKKAGLPIGSGEVESGHRSVLQKRLKRPGAWWLHQNADTMAHLKTLQSNGDWEKLWQKKAA